MEQPRNPAVAGKGAGLGSVATPKGPMPQVVPAFKPFHGKTLESEPSKPPDVQNTTDPQQIRPGYTKRTDFNNDEDDEAAVVVRAGPGDPAGMDKDAVKMARKIVEDEPQHPTSPDVGNAPPTPAIPITKKTMMK